MTRADEPPTHRVAIHGAWTMWRWTWVRAAGFPARGVLELAAPEAAAAADQLLATEDLAPALRARAIEELWQVHHGGGPSARAARQAIEQLKLGKPPRDAALLAHHSDAIRALRAHEERLAQQHDQLARAYGAALVTSAEALRSVITNARFREALVWQNRNALRACDWLQAHPDATNTRARQNQHLIASYVQRYSVKNDTIGFFGPISWGELAATELVAATPGRQLLGKRRVYLEYWAIDALAAAIASADDIKPLLAPRLLPSVAVSGLTLHYGFGRTSKLPPLVARLLTACDGETPAREIARVLVADDACDVADAAEVYELVEELVERKLVTWTIELADLTHPERELRRVIERLEDPEVRDRALAVVARLVTARDRVTAAAGDVKLLEGALEDLDTTFHELTGAATTRRAGQTYAARTPVYEDCVRDLSLVIGRPVLDRLGPVFALVAQSARWFTHEIASRYRTALHACFRALAQTSPGPIRYLRFLHELHHLLPATGKSPELVEIEEELARRWTAILDVDMAQSRVDRTCAELVDRVQQAFAAPGPGWPGARHISPDVLIGARGIDAITRGELTIVLGEIHIGNTLLPRFIIPHGPDEDDSLIRAYDLDMSGPRVYPIGPRHQLHRAQSCSWSARDVELELGTSKSWRPRTHVLRAADLVVEEVSSSLVVRDLRSGREFDVIAFLEAHLAPLTANEFKPAPRGPHVPRVTIDGVVLCREQWRFSPTDLPSFDEGARGPQQFAAVRRWARSVGLPRWVFVKIPEEPKPVYVDFESPIYVEMFAKLVRKATSVAVSEMLPTVEESWIPDAEGQTYTGELRMVAVDPVPWTAPGADAAAERGRS